MNKELRNAIAIAMEIGYLYGKSNLSREEGRFEQMIDLLNSHKNDVSQQTMSCIQQHLACIDNNRE